MSCARPSMRGSIAQDQIYLDYTGGGLYAESQLREHMALLSGDVFGNPHSTNPTSHGDDANWSSMRASSCSTTSTPRPTSTAVIFTPTPAARSSWSASRIPSRRAASIC